MGTTLDGKVALVTGAARGQGRAEALMLAERGADVIALDICGPIKGRESFPPSTTAQLDRLGDDIQALGRQARTFAVDTRDLPAVEDAVEQGLAAFGHLDVVVANAGIAGSRALVHEIAPSDWQATIDVNLTGVWHTVRAALPPMIEAGKGGSIIITSSAIVANPRAHVGDYGAAKAGVSHLMRTLAIENGRYGIRVNAILPGNVDSPMVMNEPTFRLFRPDLESPGREDVLPLYADMALLKEKALLDPEDIANAVAWLASDEAAYVTGITMAVDMGWILNNGSPWRRS
ncbi:MAG TPA: mycofactocin-coupled SDR family oxidoreductase [Acidimicrobiales bacterium]|nr:mycofactocin-coupled SDR family oxidoreductase [Acidimicrobiales bacterium]